MFEPITITLGYPLLHGNEEVTKLVFGREMEAGDLQGIPVTGMNHDDIYIVAGRIAGIPASVLKRMKMPDYLKVAEIVGSFFGDSLPTGGKQ